MAAKKKKRVASKKKTKAAPKKKAKAAPKKKKAKAAPKKKKAKAAPKKKKAKAAPKKKKAKAAPKREKYPSRDGPIRDDVVKERTGKVWAEWFWLLDKWGAKEQPHATIARHLQKEHGLKGWWAQTVTIRYEQERGLREVGQTSKGWQTSAQKTVSKRPSQAWDCLMRMRARGRWLGSMVVRMELREGARYRLADGTEGEVRAVRAPKLLRLTWEHGTGDHSTVELTLTGKGGKTQVRVQHSGIPNKSEREKLQERWKSAAAVFDQLVW